ncbi:MAG: VCBS repeat-containing protein [Deltaproteobacteria bacterium]|nr:VCBS repeat-containing protein [Deltaproteobacteria bacterium]
MTRWILGLGVVFVGVASLGCGDDAGAASDGGVSRRDASRPPRRDGGSSTGGSRNPVCAAGSSAGEVEAPVFVKNLRGETSWYASPVVQDLDGDGANELIAAYYSVFVFDSAGELITQAEGGDGRVYAPHVVTDLEGDGIFEVVYGNGSEVWAYEYRDRSLVRKAGWPVDTTTAGNSPEVRGLAAADLDGDGLVEVVATTTQTERTEDGGAQVFVFAYDGSSYQPPGVSYQAWPRYNNRTGPGGDADRNGMGHSGFGQYGLNVGIGNIDDDPELEILATYDNHHIQAFDLDGEAIDASPYFSNRASEFAGERLTWGQFIRWADPAVEEQHYNLHTGEWPSPRTQEWLQWTASPPNVVDLNLDGKNEVLGVPNVEMNEPYETQAYAIMVLEGAYGDGSRSARRLAGWETLPRGGRPISVDGYYPPNGVPAATTVDIQGDAAPEIVVSLNDGSMRAFDAGGAELWRYDYTGGRAVMYASEAVVADLNQDGSPEVIFSTYGAPDVSDSGHLIVLGADGSLLHDVALPDPGSNGNGNGAPAAPGVGDLDSDGQLEIFVQTFDHGMDMFTVPGSGTSCVLWSTARGGPLRMGQPNRAE